MVLTKQERSGLRANLFRHLDGIVTAPTAYTLYEAGVLDYLLENPTSQLKEITKTFKANEGYLNVALRVLCSQDWLTQQIEEDGTDIKFSLTEKGKHAFKHAKYYKASVNFIALAVKLKNFMQDGLDPESYRQLRILIEEQKRNYSIEFSADDTEHAVQNQILQHIEGLVAGPLIVSLGINGMFHRYFSLAPFKPEEFSSHHDQLKTIIDLFASLGWFSEKEGIFNFTPKGLFYAKRASAYGVTVSYLPTFMHLKELIFGAPTVLWDKPEGSPELHVDRGMNVWGSGGAHATYFKKIDEIIIELFDKPIEQQPIGFADMGCGNGALLEHIFDVIWSKTRRGKMLSEHPLFIVGSDFNEAALTATQNTLNQAGIWAKVVWGDIGNPGLLAKELKEKYEINLGDLLNVRSFLDHNRIYSSPKATDSKVSLSSGAFSFRGKRINNTEVVNNLVEHLEKWTPYVRKFGLLLIELHTISPELAAKNIGKTAVTAYDATHGFSDQYILELDCFLKAAEAAGLHPVPSLQTKFPESDLATISINVFKAEEFINK
jgi:DNA-binding MarR family transcriptional regulator